MYVTGRDMMLLWQPACRQMFQLDISLGLNMTLWLQLNQKLKVLLLLLSFLIVLLGIFGCKHWLDLKMQTLKLILMGVATATVMEEVKFYSILVKEWRLLFSFLYQLIYIYIPFLLNLLIWQHNIEVQRIFIFLNSFLTAFMFYFVLASACICKFNMTNTHYHLFIGYSTLALLEFVFTFWLWWASCYSARIIFSCILLNMYVSSRTIDFLRESSNAS